MPDDIDLTNLTAQLGFIIQGDAAGDIAGYSVSSAGDVNGDGIDDIIVGAPRGDDGGDQAGEAYVIYGTMGADRGLVDLSELSPDQGFIIQGDTMGDNAGHSVSSAGDVNGDGIDDIIVGVPDHDNFRGAAYVIYGTTETERGLVDLSDLSADQGFIIEGNSTNSSPNDQAGFSVSSGGDVNGDGIDDIIVGAPDSDDVNFYGGEVYVVYGSAETERGKVELNNLTSDVGFVIKADMPYDSAGFSVSSGGDVNGDGIEDIIVGAPYGDDGDNQAGEAYVIYGTAGTDRDLVDLSELTPDQGFIIQGDAMGDEAGHSVSSAGDVNGDGIDDIIVGAQFGDDGGEDAGEAYVIYGTTAKDRGLVDLTDLNAADGFIIQGDVTRDWVGGSVTSGGDVNGDGIDDIIVGAPGGDDGGGWAGETYVIYGITGTDRGLVDLTGLNATDGFIIQGDRAFDDSAFSVSTGGDVNGDGIDDIVVGAFNGDDGGFSAGEAYVVYGAVTTEGETLVDDGTNNLVTGGDGSDIIVGIAGNDDITGGLGGDLIIGGFDSDTLDGGIGDDILIGDNNALIAGNDRLTGGIGDDLLDGGAGADTFVFGTQQGDDTIGKIAFDYDSPFRSEVIGADFVSGVDLIELQGFAISTGAEALALVSDVDGVATFASEGTTITFAGLTAADLSADDFTFI